MLWNIDDPEDLCTFEIPRISGLGIKRVRKRERKKNTQAAVYNHCCLGYPSLTHTHLHQITTTTGLFTNLSRFYFYLNWAKQN